MKVGENISIIEECYIDDASKIKRTELCHHRNDYFWNVFMIITANISGQQILAFFDLAMFEVLVFN